MPDRTDPAAALALRVDRTDPRPLPTQIASQLRALALSGGASSPQRLPSTRRLAADLQVARGVVEAAWDQLRAEGWLESRRGSGTWLVPVTLPSPSPTPGALPSPGLDEDLVMMDAGTPWRDRRHDAAWRRAWREMSTSTPPRGYDDPRGTPTLRAALAQRLSRTRGLVVGAGDVRVTGGTTAGLRHLLTGLVPGPVALEDPGYRAAVLTVTAS
ncbi:MAG: GntR family transcriptional regulator, partial [Nocardioides sp.]|uniref:GntR family transcriptional regulator n=1 Tax=Nocardioides sp. TaxID=35761 RepID=UPI003F06253B